MSELKIKKDRKERKILPPIPEKYYFSISEVSDLCALKPHVLRYWEQEFPDLKPDKRKGNRRYYQHKDIVLVREIRSLLYDQRFTIDGAKARLNRARQDMDQKAFKFRDQLREVIHQLEGVLSVLEEGKKIL